MRHGDDYYASDLEWDTSIADESRRYVGAVRSVDTIMSSWFTPSVWMIAWFFFGRRVIHAFFVRRSNLFRPIVKIGSEIFFKEKLTKNTM